MAAGLGFLSSHCRDISLNLNSNRGRRASSPRHWPEQVDRDRQLKILNTQSRSAFTILELIKSSFMSMYYKSDSASESGPPLTRRSLSWPTPDPDSRICTTPTASTERVASFVYDKYARSQASNSSPSGRIRRTMTTRRLRASSLNGKTSIRLINRRGRGYNGCRMKFQTRDDVSAPRVRSNPRDERARRLFTRIYPNIRRIRCEFCKL
ncbi:hypothetical protein EVAR_51028_1 [Eumeta japonica]|uniref:Uncharacterized protein n=1 Tax=Eumeta variegata TaxID=151549 RepID=A0A4C1Y844_EUMVA|nr:hypothetical protein EVAR_51028_1 [Eumeta japonica]